MRRFPQGKCSRPVLVSGTAVIANNYFVSFASVFKHLFGGELKGYTAMCADARRLAIVRMLQEAEAAGANAVFNVRFETANVLTANSQKQSGGVELIVYGTAMRLDA
ncbi:MAG: heavy metal-binding domain-containing protein [Planctomycetes bacterium]|nr:heavy metal-binding domain-containing protein [Planctomycetota bacterium]